MSLFCRLFTLFLLIYCTFKLSYKHYGYEEQQPPAGGATTTGTGTKEGGRTGGWRDWEVAPFVSLGAILDFYWRINYFLSFFRI